MPIHSWGYSSRKVAAKQELINRFKAAQERGRKRGKK